MSRRAFELWKMLEEEHGKIYLIEMKKILKVAKRVTYRELYEALNKLRRCQRL